MSNENKAIDRQCKTCVRIRQGYCDGAAPEDRECQFYKRMTNADRIRKMTDDELAALLAGCACPTIENIGRCKEFHHFCDSCWLDWLKQEVEG